MTKSTMKRLGGLTMGLALMGSLATGSFAAEPTAPITAAKTQIATALVAQDSCTKCTEFIDMDNEARSQFIEDNKDENGNTAVCEHIVFGNSIMVPLNTATLPEGVVYMDKVVDGAGVSAEGVKTTSLKLVLPDGVEMSKINLAAGDFVDMTAIVGDITGAVALTPSIEATPAK